MIKCKKCNSANVKVNFSSVYTSIPAQYGYVCQDCGELNFVDCNKVNMRDFNGDGYQIHPKTNEDLQKLIETPKENNNTDGLLGWICPKCGRCYSPFTTMCSFCNNSGDNCITATYKNTL